MQENADASIPLTPSRAGAAGPDRLGYLVLVRIAAEVRPIARNDIAVDLAVLAGQRPLAPPWRAAVDRALDSLASTRLTAVMPAGLVASEAGLAAAAEFLGGEFPRSWRQLCDLWLIARALGWQQRASARRLATLETPEGLRAAILAHAFGLQIKGVATPARLRRALAEAALKRAFGDDSAGRLAGKLGLSARAGRLLAAQLLAKPRDFGTDKRLVAALAAESVGASAPDLESLRTAVRRQFLDAAELLPRSRRERRKASPPKEEPAPPPPNAEPWAPLPPPPAALSAAAPPPTPQPLDLPRFASEVRRFAASEAQGWSGDRKAYISHVWRNVRDTRPEWGLSEIEFKHLLAEAHRSGQLALANADLKDESNIKDVQDSAVVYRNAVFHFIRVEP